MQRRGKAAPLDMSHDPPAQPDVVIIQADQFRWDRFGAAGCHDVSTPHLDRLAAQAVRHTNAFCAHPVCTPSRYSMLSGLYPHQHGAWSNRSTLDPSLGSLPATLRDAGYRTAAVGKMHFTPTYLDLGYQQMRLAEQNGPGRYEDDYHRELASAGLSPVVDLVDQEPHHRAEAPLEYWSSFGAQASDLPEKWHTTSWIGENAVRMIQGWREGEANLLHVSFVKPHHPFDPSPRWLDLYDPQALAIPPGWTEHVPTQDLPFQPGYFDNTTLTEPTLRRVLWHYYASISQLDAQVGRILDALDERGRDPMIVFTSDHGEYLGFHHHLLKAGRWLYDPLMRVPLLVRYPGAADGGTVDDRLVSHLDLCPTVVEATGVEDVRRLPGVVISKGERRAVVTEAVEGRAIAIRDRRYKLVRTASGEHDAFFDLEHDPYELEDRLADPFLSAEVHALQHQLVQELIRWPAPNRLDLDAPVVSLPETSMSAAALRARFDADVRARLS